MRNSKPRTLLVPNRQLLETGVKGGRSGPQYRAFDGKQASAFHEYRKHLPQEDQLCLDEGRAEGIVSLGRYRECLVCSIRSIDVKQAISRQYNFS